jgi:hypothetical protein
MLVSNGQPTECKGCLHEVACIDPETCIAEDERLAEASLRGEVKLIAIDELKAQLRRVAQLRALSEDMQSGIATRRAAWEKENGMLLTEAAACRKSLAEEEGKLRGMTLDIYRATGDKKPVEGLGIKVMSGIKYDADEARGWAIRENTAFLVLDRPGFEAYAKVIQKSGRSIPGVKIEATETPTATIAKVLKVVE